jgi:bifunctional non-homologous end joining protein LigD
VKRDVQISHPDKKLFPGITKRDLAAYYDQVGRVTVRHMRDRPVAMEAFPGGIGAQGHFMKDRPKHFPEWIPDVRVAKRGGSLRHILVRETAALLYLAGQNVITPHVWTSRADDVRKPDRIIFDLDPATQKFTEVRAAARATGELLRGLGLSPHAMVTGSRGIHVTVPIKRVPFEEAFAFAKAVSLRLAEEHPKKLTTEFLKANREDRIFVDVLRNRYAQHAVPPYAVRPRPRAPVAAPLHWDELDDSKLKPDRWTIKTMPGRVESDGDAWHGISGRARSVSAASRRLG